MCGPHNSLPPLLAEREPPRLPTRLKDEIRCTQIGSPHPDQQHLVVIPADQRIIADANDLQALEVGKTRSVKIEMVDAVLIVGDDIATPGLAEDEGIRATAAGDPVVATTTVETIRAMAANDDIVGRRASADFLISQETRMAL